MMSRCLLVITIQLLLCCVVSTGNDCKEKDILKKLYATKPEYKQKIDSLSDSRKPKTPRSLLLALQDCTVYYGNIDIQENSADDLGFDEYVRQEDFANLKRLRVVYGFISLNLKKYPGIKSLSFLSSLRMIQSTVRGFVLFFSEVEVIGLSNVRLKVPFVGIGHNKFLCYLDNFKTINYSIRFLITGNKAPERCQIEGKACSKKCLPGTGCWGPRNNQCFQCHWKAENDCVSRCELKKEFFTPIRGRVCGRCHTTCKYGCIGPERSQCYPEGGAKDICQKHMFFDDASKQCRECSKSCFGDSFDKRRQLNVRACSGPESSAGPRGCSVKCEDMTFLAISSNGRLECSPCHENCLSCRNGSPTGCIQLKGSSKNHWWIVGVVVLCVVMIGLGLGLTFGILAVCKRLKRKRKKPKKHLRSDDGSKVRRDLEKDMGQPLESMLSTMLGLPNMSELDKDSHKPTSSLLNPASQNSRESEDDTVVAFQSMMMSMFQPQGTSDSDDRSHQPFESMLKSIFQPQGTSDSDERRHQPFESMMMSLLKGLNNGSSDDDSDGSDKASHQPSTSAQSQGATSGQPSNDILISYHQDNVETVKKISKRLQEKRFSCQMKEPNASGVGTNIWSFKVILACITEEFMKSGYVDEMNRVDELRHDSSSPVPVIIPIVLEGTKWPPIGENVSMNIFLAGKKEIEMCKEDIDEWNSENVRNLINQLRTHIGVNLLVLYNSDVHSPVTSRPEFQSDEKSSHPFKFSHMKCHLPSVSPGWCSFKDLRSALKPVFAGPQIRTMDQVRGIINEKDVTIVTSLVEDELAENITENPYCTVTGEEFSYGQAASPMMPHQIRARDRAFVCGGGRRTVLRIKFM